MRCTECGPNRLEPCRPANLAGLSRQRVSQPVVEPSPTGSTWGAKRLQVNWAVGDVRDLMDPRPTRESVLAEIQRGAFRAPLQPQLGPATSSWNPGAGPDGLVLRVVAARRKQVRPSGACCSAQPQRVVPERRVPNQNFPSSQCVVKVAPRHVGRTVAYVIDPAHGATRDAVELPGHAARVGRLPSGCNHKSGVKMAGVRKLRRESPARSVAEGGHLGLVAFRSVDHRLRATKIQCAGSRRFASLEGLRKQKSEDL
jgi:hypothetical protein